MEASLGPRHFSLSYVANGVKFLPLDTSSNGTPKLTPITFRIPRKTQGSVKAVAQFALIQHFYGQTLTRHARGG